MYPDKFVSKPSEIPSEEHYAIFEADTYYTDGYDRSDPGVSTPFVKYEVYLSKDTLLAAILVKDAASYSKKEYKACKVTPLKIEKTITIKVD